MYSIFGRNWVQPGFTHQLDGLGITCLSPVDWQPPRNHAQTDYLVLTRSDVRGLGRPYVCSREAFGPFLFCFDPGLSSVD